MLPGSRSVSFRVVVASQLKHFRLGFQGSVFLAGELTLGLTDPLGPPVGNDEMARLNLFRVRHLSHAPVMRSSSAAAPIEYLPATDELENSI